VDQKNLIIAIQKPVEKNINTKFKEPESESEEDGEIRDFVDFETKKSNASCRIKDIQSFIYGGISSRFWMYRKHTNFIDKVALD